MQSPQACFVILDFGSQLTQLIARRLRELNHFSLILPYHTPLADLQKLAPRGIILSGGPSSVYEKGAPVRNIPELANLAPLLGICYGMQLIAHDLGGRVESAQHREYGFNRIQWDSEIPGVPKTQNVWMSHGDIVHAVPPGFQILAHSESGHIAAMGSSRVMGLQFHPEVAHTVNGTECLRFFCETLCETKPSWTGAVMLESLQAQVRTQVGATAHVLVALSGGVDSSVVAALLTRTLGPERVHCVFVNNGLLRENEYTQVLGSYQKLGLNVHGVDATLEFLQALKGLKDPEQKRKAIGRVFIEVFESEVKARLKAFDIQFLAQGTLYPDVIESVSFSGGPSQTIKSHHNVGGLPARMKLKLVEPVRELFKDEVRRLGRELGLPAELVARHPFPGPGLSIRVIGEVTPQALALARAADAIFIQKIRDHGLYDKIWQAFCVLLPVQTVGVQGDGRTYDQVLALRAVTSTDGMTADWYPFSGEFLRDVSGAITNQVKGISRVVLDVTSKPPATIEWE